MKRMLKPFERRGLWMAGLLGGFLLATGCVKLHRVEYRLPRTALVPYAAAGIEDRSVEYGSQFCSILRYMGEEGGPWGECADYIETPGSSDLDLPSLPTEYRVLVLPGVFGQCFSPKVQAFSDALAHLREKHGLDAEYLDVPALGSCEYNAAVIAQELRMRMEEDPRKFIVVGYSKGGCDVMVALAAYPEVREAVAALVTVASPIGGSRLPDIVPGYIQRFLEEHKLGPCEKGDSGGLESVRRTVRQSFLQEHPVPAVTTYSLVAVSEEATTTRVLRPFWRKLSMISLDQDAQVIASEGVPPGARFLGMLKGDHWAIALPFELHDDSLSRSLSDHNHFPRTALLEAAIRVVIADLQSGRKVDLLPAN